MKVIQIVPTIGPGTGVGAVAHHLEREWRDMGVETSRFTMSDAHGDWLPDVGPGARGKVALLLRVGWFSTVGTVLAGRLLRRDPDAISVCHNDALVGDVYVNHGIVHVSLARRGHRLWRTLRNPLHAFTWLRDAVRYGSSRYHRVVVNLVSAEDRVLRRTYPLLRLPTRVIGNGVDTQVHRPATPAERQEARRRLGIPAGAFAILFIGHEYERKGLVPLLDAVAGGTEDWHLIVVGGTSDMVQRLRERPSARGLGERLHTLGQLPDPRAALHAADVLATPSVYESYGLVVLEAMASGLPVVASPTGCAPDVIVDGVNGWLCASEPSALRDRLARIATADRAALGHAARRTAEQHSWREAARGYLTLFAELAGEPPSPPEHQDGGQSRRIVHAIRSTGFAGVERHVAELASAQARAGYDVTVLGGDPDRMRCALDPGAHFAPASTGPKLVRQLLRHVRSRTPDLVHAHMSAAELAAALVTPAGTALVTTRHFAARRGSHPAARAVLGLVSRRFHAQIAVSAHVADRVEGDCVVIHPGVPELPAPGTGRRRPVVLVAQRLEREKETDIALRAFAASGLHRCGWQLEVAGDGSHRDVLVALAETLGIASAVCFLGHRDDVPALMRRAGIFIAPCGREGLGLSVLEAMDAGLPVVAAAAGGHLESLGGVPAAALFPVGDAVAAGALLSDLASDTARREAYGAALRERRGRAFSTRAQVTATHDVYEHALAAARPHLSARGPKDIVVVSLEAWDQVWRRNQHLVAGLLRTDPGCRVLFVEPAADPLHSLRTKGTPRIGRGLRRAPHLPGTSPDALWLFQPTKLLPRRIDPGQDRRWADAVIRAAATIGAVNPTLWVNDPQGAELLRTSWPALYDITDDWLAAARDGATHARLVRQEAALMSEVAEVVVCSTGLARTKSRDRPVTLLHNAVDAEDQRLPRPRPEDLPPGPVAVYVGTLHGDRLDVALCVEVALALEGTGSLVLVGPNSLTPAEDARLAAAGAYRLGPKDRASVPAYLQHADVLLVPHVVDEFTESLDPIKLYEYAAVGRPVVSTPVAGFREAEGPRTRIASGADFVAAVCSAVPADDAFPVGARDDVPTWADRVAEMRVVLDRVARPALRPALDGAAQIPLPVRVRLGHAALQRIADRAGVDVLHIKGASLAPALVHEGRQATDVDVLVRPEHVERLLSALADADFRSIGRFSTSSPFEHSATLWHEHWGYIDVHRMFPGIGLDPAQAFEQLWQGRTTTVIGGIECTTPGVDAQGLLLLLHAARSARGGQASRDVAHVWEAAGPAGRERLREQVRLLDAQTAFTVSLGGQADPTDPRQQLWHALAHGHGRLDEWHARIIAAPDLLSRARLLARLPLVNTDHLTMLLGRRPTRAEIVAEFFHRPARAARELGARLRRPR